MDGQTDRQTEMLYQYRAVLRHDKNQSVGLTRSRNIKTYYQQTTDFSENSPIRKISGPV